MSYFDMQPATDKQIGYMRFLGRDVLGLTPQEYDHRLYEITGGRIVHDPPMRRHDASRVIKRFKREIKTKGVSTP